MAEGQMMVWFQSDDLVWLPAIVVGDASAGEVQLKLSSGNSIQTTKDRIARVNPPAYDNVINLSRLLYVDEPNMLFHFSLRYNSKHIYTEVSEQLIYISSCTVDPQPVVSQQPHLEQFLEDLSRNVHETGGGRNIILKGGGLGGPEDVATTAVRILGRRLGQPGIATFLESAAQLIHAFTQTATLTIPSRSVVTTYMKLHVSRRQRIIGAAFDVAIPQLHRLAQPPPGEANFHVLHVMQHVLRTHGLAAVEQVAGAVEGAVSSDYLQLGGNMQGGGWHTWDRLEVAMKQVGLSQDTCDDVARCLALILAVGSIRFVLKASRQVVPQGDTTFEAVWKLLDVEPDEVWEYFAPEEEEGQVVRSGLHLERLKLRRDSLAMALYTALLDWLQAQINVYSMQQGGLAMADAHIGVLLPMGCLASGQGVGGLDDLLASYTEEAVQQLSHEVTFKRLEWMAREEEVPSAAAVPPYHDNLQHLRALHDPAKKEGVLPALDIVLGDDCLGDDDSDGAFLKRQLQVSVHSDLLTYRRAPSDEFSVQHSWGKAVYSYSRLIEDSRFNSYQGAVDILRRSNSHFLRDLGSGLRHRMQQQRHGSAGMQYVQQVERILAPIPKGPAHVVQCIKPNSDWSQWRFDNLHVLKQMRQEGSLQPQWAAGVHTLCEWNRAGSWGWLPLLLGNCL